MPLDQITPYLPGATIAAGSLLLLWSLWGRLKTWAVAILPDKQAEPNELSLELTVYDLVDAWRMLRAGCQGRPEAQKALVEVVWPAVADYGNSDEKNSADNGGPQP